MADSESNFDSIDSFGLSRTGCGEILLSRDELIIYLFLLRPFSSLFCKGSLNIHIMINKYDLKKYITGDKS